MLTQTPMLESPPPATEQEKQWTDTFGTHAKQANISPGCSVGFIEAGMPSINLVDGLNYLKYEPLAPWAGGWGTPSLSSSLDPQKEKLKWGNGEVEIITSDFRAKVNIYLKYKPDSNHILIKFDSNLNPIFHEEDEEGSGEYNYIYWSPTLKRKDSVYYWDKVHIYDNSGNYTHGKYIGLDGKGNAIVEIDQGFLDVADYSGTGVIIDPTVQLIVNSLPDSSRNRCGKWTNFNGTRYVAFFDKSPGDDPVIMVTADLTVTGTDEFGNSPFVVGDALKTSVVHFSDGDQLFFGQNPSGADTIYCALWDAGGTWDVSKTQASTGTVAGFGFDTCVDANDTVFLLYWSGGFILRKSDDKGQTWTTMTAPGIGGNSTYRAYDLSADDSGNLNLFYHPGAAASQIPRGIVYDISGNSWSGDGNIGTSTLIWRKWNQWRTAYESDGSVIVIFDDNFGTVEYSANRSGSFVQDLIVGGQPGWGPPIIDDQDDYYYLTISFGGEVKQWDFSPGIWGFAGDTPWWNGYAPWAITEVPPIPALRNGESVWCIVATAAATYWAENTNYNFLAGGDTDPPTGGSLTAPADEAEDISLVPVVSVAGWEDDTTPIDGYVDIDTVNTFDSTDLQTSGWFVLEDEGGGEWGGSFSSWDVLEPNTLYYIRDRARDDAETPNVSEYNPTQTFTTGWIWSGITQPKIVYNGTTIKFPVPVSCQILPGSISKENVALDGSSIEFIDQGAPKIMKVRIQKHYSVAFEAAMDTFFRNWGGQKKWFDFTSGQDVRNDGDWLLQDTEMKPKISGGLRMYDLTFWRPYD